MLSQIPSHVGKKEKSLALAFPFLFSTPIGVAIANILGPAFSERNKEKITETGEYFFDNVGGAINRTAIATIGTGVALSVFGPLSVLSAIGAALGYTASKNTFPEQDGISKHIKTAIMTTLGVAGGVVAAPVVLAALGATGTVGLVASGVAMSNMIGGSNAKQKAYNSVVAGVQRPKGAKRLLDRTLGFYLSDYDGASLLWKNQQERSDMIGNLYKTINYIQTGPDEALREELFHQLSKFLPMRFKTKDEIFLANTGNPENMILEFLQNILNDSAFIVKQNPNISTLLTPQKILQRFFEFSKTISSPTNINTWDYRIGEANDYTKNPSLFNSVINSPEAKQHTLAFINTTNPTYSVKEKIYTEIKKKNGFKDPQDFSRIVQAFIDYSNSSSGIVANAGKKTMFDANPNTYCDKHSFLINNEFNAVSNNPNTRNYGFSSQTSYQKLLFVINANPTRGNNILDTVINSIQQPNANDISSVFQGKPLELFNKIPSYSQYKFAPAEPDLSRFFNDPNLTNKDIYPYLSTAEQDSLNVDFQNFLWFDDLLKNLLTNNQKTVKVSTGVLPPRVPQSIIDALQQKQDPIASTQGVVGGSIQKLFSFLNPLNSPQSHANFQKLLTDSAKKLFFKKS